MRLIAAKISEQSDVRGALKIQQQSPVEVGSRQSLGLRRNILVIQNLKEELKLKKFNTNLGDEGGFAPSFDSDEKAIEYIIKAVKKTGLKIGKDINICLDVAANELYTSGKYKIKENKNEFRFKT